MSLIKEFDKGLENWESRLQDDEWYFVKLREAVTSDLKFNEAFGLISDTVELVLKQENEFLCFESFKLLLDLSRISDTTEMPSNLRVRWDDLCNHVMQFGDYHTKQVNELKRWYRKD